MSRFGRIVPWYRPDGSERLADMSIPAPTAVEVWGDDFFLIGDVMYLGPTLPVPLAANDA